MRHLICSLFLPFLYWGSQFVISMLLFQTSFVKNTSCLIVTALSLLLFLALELVLEHVRKSKQELERELLQQEIAMYENQFDIIRQSQKNIRSLRHDLKHHVKMLSDMIADQDNEAALQYLASMGAFMENAEEYVSSGNERIDSILNYMISKARTARIDTDWKIQIPEHLNISTFDINVILSNLFDNAFQALQKAASPSLHILMKYDRGVLCISLKNNGAQNLDFPRKEKNLLTELSAEHGYGLKNVKRISEKYHGDLSISCQDGVCNASVLLFLANTAPA